MNDRVTIKRAGVCHVSANSEIEKQFWTDYNSNDWEPETFQVFDRFVEPGKTVLDVGAWIGPTTIYASQLGAKVHSYEPDPVAFRRLSTNIEQNAELSERVTLHQYGLADRKDTCRFYAVGQFGHSGASLHAFHEDCIVTEIKVVDCRTEFESFDPKSICLIKMDIEGGEYAAIPRVAEYLKEHLPNLYLSLHPAKIEKTGNKVRDEWNKFSHSQTLRRLLSVYRYCYHWNGTKWTNQISLKDGLKEFLKCRFGMKPELVFSNEEFYLSHEANRPRQQAA